MADPAFARSPPLPADSAAASVNHDAGPPLSPAGHCGSLARLSSVQRTIEQFLDARPFERGPWLAVGFGAGIAGWAALPGPWQWAALIALCAAAMVFAALLGRGTGADHTARAIMAMALMVAAGCTTIWAKSALVGTPPLALRQTAMLTGRVVDRIDTGGAGPVQIVLAARIAGVERPMLVKVIVPDALDQPGLIVGATITARARIGPPPPPMLPGAHDFAFAAWFAGIGATGSLAGPVTLIESAPPRPSLRRVQAALHAHVVAHLPGSAGAIAATLVSGDRGAIARADADAMRDAGFAHLLSISGLHVSAVIAGVYLLLLRTLALIPWLALRVRLPLLAALGGALAGVAYCLITGSQVPTIRSAAGAVLVLGALALGRDPLSMRLLAAAALVVMLFWPEAVLGPSFQMSFGAVIAVIALYGAAPVKRFIARRDESAVIRLARHGAMLLISGLVIEAALMPIALFHFHRNGVYGAFANLLAIPLMTLVTMPLLALALALDLIGCGAPAWWATGQSLDAMLWIAHTTASLPGAVTTLPMMPGGVFALCVAGLLWLALWSGRVRWYGLIPAVIGAAALAGTRAPDILIAGDGRHVGITGLGPDLVVLGETRGHLARDSLLQAAGMAGIPQALEDWPGARCTHDFCALALTRAGRRSVLLIAHSHRRIDPETLAPACAQSDIVIADYTLPASCHPRSLRVDAALLARTGGMTINLASGTVRTVAATSANHPWLRWRIASDGQ